MCIILEETHFQAVRKGIEMDIGERIKRRREELDMSQAELARKVGYSSRSTITRIERDGNGIFGY